MVPRMVSRATLLPCIAALASCGFLLPPGKDHCGDGVRGPLEPCDPTYAPDAAWCHDDCEWGWCGDGVLQPNEACDDPGVGTCTEGCTSGGCGDGASAAGEVCFSDTPLRIEVAAHDLDLGDVDGDGDADLAWAHAGGITVWIDGTPPSTIEVPLADPRVVGIVPASGVPDLWVVYADSDQLWRLSATPQGWSEPLAAETLPANGLDVRMHGDLPFVQTEGGWYYENFAAGSHVLLGAGPVALADTPHRQANASGPYAWYPMPGNAAVNRASFFNIASPGSWAGSVATDPTPTSLQRVWHDNRWVVLGSDGAGHFVRMDLTDENDPTSSIQALEGPAGDLVGGALVDDDDVLDALMITEHNVAILLGGNPSEVHNVLVTPPIAQAFLADVDGDGHVDLVTRHADAIEIRFAEP